MKTSFDFYNAVWLCVVSFYNITTTAHMVRFKLAAYVFLFQQTPDARTPPHFHGQPINIVHLLSTVTGYFSELLICSVSVQRSIDRKKEMFAAALSFL